MHGRKASDAALMNFTPQANASHRAWKAAPITWMHVTHIGNGAFARHAALAHERALAFPYRAATRFCRKSV